MPNPGALRFNTDSLKMELFDGNQWVELVATSADSQTGGARGLFGGGYTPTFASSNIIDYITISTTGNALDFGDLTGGRAICQSLASRTRGIWQGGRSSINIIDYITISSTGNALDFGDLTQGREDPCGISNGTRGVFGGGGQHPGSSPLSAFVNTIDYVTIASTGNANDFGDLTQARRHHGSCASSTRGIFAGGYSPTSLNVIDFITTSTLGNASDFGDLAVQNFGIAGCSNAVRGLFSLGQNTGINYITISTLGNAQYFGDLTSRKYAAGSCASQTRGIWGGGYTPSITNAIDYVQIMTTGNSIDFGDTTNGRYHLGACSNAHGGL